MTTLHEIKNAFIAAGWSLKHVSKDDGTERSFYFEKRHGPALKPRFVNVRISDHHLGCTVHGEAQGGSFDYNFVTEDMDKALEATTVVKAVETENDEMVDLICSGYSPADNEWNEVLA